jgi:hypothetical protein
VNDEKSQLMRMTTRTLPASIVLAGAGVAIFLAPVASADPTPDPQTCTTSGEGGQTTGTQTTVCQTPGNFQLNATAPTEPDYPYPWDDEFYGSAMILGPNEPMHSFGGDGPHR